MLCDETSNRDHLFVVADRISPLLCCCGVCGLSSKHSAAAVITTINTIILVGVDAGTLRVSGRDVAVRVRTHEYAESDDAAADDVGAEEGVYLLHT